MKDMIPKGTGNSRKMKSSIPANITHEELVALLRSGEFPFDLNGLNPEGITQQGTPLNKATLLTDDTAQMLGITKDDPTVDDAFQAVHNRIKIVTHAEVITLSGTWIAPENVLGGYVNVLCYGGGGAGGDCAVSSSQPGRSAAGGGSGGHWEKATVQLRAGEVVPVTVALSSDAAGGTTSFGEYVSALGGSKGSPGQYSGRNPMVGGNGASGGSGGGAGGSTCAEYGNNGNPKYASGSSVGGAGDSGGGDGGDGGVRKATATMPQPGMAGIDTTLLDEAIIGDGAGGAAGSQVGTSYMSGGAGGGGGGGYGGRGGRGGNAGAGWGSFASSWVYGVGGGGGGGGGYGAQSTGGAGGAPGIPNSTTGKNIGNNGNPGQGFGSGGGGASGSYDDTTSKVGGDGAPGVIIVTWNSYEIVNPDDAD